MIKAIAFEACHITELLVKLIEKGKIKPKTGVTGRFTYHDHCHLTRLGTPGTLVFEKPRSIIESITDISWSLSRAAKTMGVGIELFDITTLLAKCLDLRV